MSDILRMVFRNASDRLTAISIPDPAPDLTAMEVESVMDSVLAKNVFMTSGGELTSKVKAEIVSRTVDVVAEF